MKNQHESGLAALKGAMVPAEKVHVPEIVSPIEGLSVDDKLKLEILLERLIVDGINGIKITGETKVSSLQTIAILLEQNREGLDKLHAIGNGRLVDIARALKKDLEKIPGHYRSETE